MNCTVCCGCKWLLLQILFSDAVSRHGTFRALLSFNLCVFAFFYFLFKAIVWDEYLTGPFGLIAQYSLLKVREIVPKNTYSGQNIISYFKDTGDYFNDYFMLFQESVCLNFIFQKEHEVEKMFTLKGGRIPSAAVKNIVFFVRPRLELMDIIAENVAR